MFLYPPQVAPRTPDKEGTQQQGGEEIFPADKGGRQGTDIVRRPKAQQEKQGGQSEKHRPVVEKGGGQIPLQQGEAEIGDAAAGTFQTREEPKGAGEPEPQRDQHPCVKQSSPEKGGRHGEDPAQPAFFLPFPLRGPAG